MTRGRRASTGKFFLLAIFALLTAFFLLGHSAEAATIRLCSPVGAEVYIQGHTMTIEWEASLDEGDPEPHWVDFYYRWEGGGWHFIGSGTYGQWQDGTYEWTVPGLDPDRPETSLLQIRARLTGLDLPIIGTGYSWWVTIIPSADTPSVYLTQPQPTLCDPPLVLIAGDTYPIRWDVTGCDDLWDVAGTVYYSPGGGIWHGIVTLFPCQRSEYEWNVPYVDTTYAKIRLDWPPHGQSQTVNMFTITTEGGVNRAPTANAGEDQTVAERSTVTLHGEGSSDPDGDDLTYQWVRIDTWYHVIDLQNANTPNPSFVAPDVAVGDVTFSFRLTVEDGRGGSDDDAVSVTVTPSEGGPRITRFTPGEGWFKTPITIYGTDLQGSQITMHGQEVVHIIPSEGDTEFTFYLSDLPLGETPITVSNPPSGSFTTSTNFNVLRVPYQWDWGFQFINPGGYDLSWADYEGCFGDEVLQPICCDRCTRRCHRVTAQYIYDEFIQGFARPGTCYGVSRASLKYFYGDYDLYDYEGELQPVREYPWYEFLYPPDENQFSRTIKQDHIQQISDVVIIYLLDHLNDLPSEIVEQIREDTESGNPGIISIFNIQPGPFSLMDIGGHAMVVDRVEQVSDTEWRIYVYDSNRPEFSMCRDNYDTTDFARITDLDEYPYITVDTSGRYEEWSFEMASGTIYGSNTGYVVNISGLIEGEVPFYGLIYWPREVATTDSFHYPLHGLFSILGRVLTILGGAGASGIENSNGDVLGYDENGDLHFEIASGAPIVPLGGLLSEQEAYAFPDDHYQINVYGKEEGHYSWASFHKNNMFAIENAQVNGLTRDTLRLGKGNSSLSFQTTDAEKEYSAKIVKTITTDTSTFRRVYEVLGSTISNRGPARFWVSPDSKHLVYENHSDHPINFNLRLIQVLLGPQPEPPDLPPIEDVTLSSEDIEIPANITLIMGASDWENLAGASVTSEQVSSGNIPAPTEQSWFDPYGGIETPAISPDPASARPMGVGSVATGGDSLDFQVSLLGFEGPVDIYLVYYIWPIDPDNLYFVTETGTVAVPVEGFSIEQTLTEEMRFRSGITEPVPWSLGSIPLSDLPPADYHTFLGVTPHNDTTSYYIWHSYFVLEP